MVSNHFLTRRELDTLAAHTDNQSSTPTLDPSSGAGERDHTTLEIFTLNVGGTKFQTTRETLTKVPDSFFETLLSGRWSVTLDREGCIFIDRDPGVFGIILKYLRDYPKPKIYPGDLKYDQLKLLAEDASFYQLSELFELLDSILYFGKGMITRAECDWLLSKLPIGRHNAPKLFIQVPDRGAKLVDFDDWPKWYHDAQLALYKTKCGWIFGRFHTRSSYTAITLRRPDGGNPMWSSASNCPSVEYDPGENAVVVEDDKDGKVKYRISKRSIWQVDMQPSH